MLLSVTGWQIGSVVIASFPSHIPHIPRDMLAVNLRSVRMLGTHLQDFLTLDILADLLPYEVTDFQCGF